MARRGAGGRVSQGIPQRREPSNGLIELICLRGEHLRVDSRRAAAFSKQAAYFIQRESGGLARSDQLQTLQHAGIEKTPQASPADRRDQAPLLVIAQCRRRHARSICNLRNVQIPHPLDLKST